MKRKSELKDIAGYLPYGLKGFCCDKNDNSDRQYYRNIVHIGLSSVDWYLSHPEKVKPILRPLSDLYRTITHNGKEIVPIVELAKIAGYKNAKWIKEKGCEISRNEYFNFDGTEAYTESRELFETYIDYIKYNLYLLFDYLHELKIDYRGLIDAGLSVSVYDLENKPYK